MRILQSFSWVKFFKSLHGWLGFFVMPWIVVIGLTGIYLNHSKLIFSYLPSGSYDESRFDDWPSPRTLDQNEAQAVAAGVWADETFKLLSDTSYHKRLVYTFKSSSGQVIVDAKTGHYWVKTKLVRRTFDPDGRALDRKIYWGRVFKTLHTAGWIDRTLGTWLADIAAGAMVVFGITGIVLFLSPRLRRRKNRKAKMDAAAVNQSVPPRPQRIRLKS